MKDQLLVFRQTINFAGPRRVPTGPGAQNGAEFVFFKIVNFQTSVKFLLKLIITFCKLEKVRQ